MLCYKLSKSINPYAKEELFGIWRAAVAVDQEAVVLAVAVDAALAGAAAAAVSAADRAAALLIVAGLAAADRPVVVCHLWAAL